MPPSVRRRWAAPLLLIAATGGGCGGGGGEDEAAGELRYEALRFREALAEVPMGDFSVPVPVNVATGPLGVARQNRVQFRFVLHALVDPADATKTSRLVERRKGQLRDDVMRVCRNSSLDELLDPQLATLRTRLLDATQPLLESVTLRRVLVTGRMTEPL